MPRWDGVLRSRDIKVCIICSKSFQRKTGVSDKVWEVRECCSRKCSNVRRHKPDALKVSIKRRHP